MALAFGEPTAEDPSRMGFSVGVDAHPTFLDGDVLTTLTLGLGAEWY